MYSKIFVSIATVVVVMVLSCPGGLAQRPKILALHGAYGNPNEFRNSRGMRDLEAALPEFEFVYAKAQYPFPEPPFCNNCNIWIDGFRSDADVFDIDNDSIAELDRIVAEEGPFYAILGYSQGSAYVQTYLSNAPLGTFQKAIMFCGYEELRHRGLTEEVQANTPWGDIPGFIWLGLFDFVIPPPFTRRTVELFTDPVVVESPIGTHAVPGTNDPTFPQVVSYIRNNDPVAVCTDDPEFSVLGKGCDWVAEDPETRCNKGVKGKTFSDICPETCGLCQLI